MKIVDMQGNKLTTSEHVTFTQGLPEKSYEHRQSVYLTLLHQSQRLSCLWSVTLCSVPWPHNLKFTLRLSCTSTAPNNPVSSNLSFFVLISVSSHCSSDNVFQSLKLPQSFRCGISILIVSLIQHDLVNGRTFSMEKAWAWPDSLSLFSIFIVREQMHHVIAKISIYAEITIKLCLVAIGEKTFSDSISHPFI